MFAGPSTHGRLQTPQYLLDEQHCRAYALQDVLECIDNNILTQVIKKSVRRAALLNLMHTDRVGLPGVVKVEDR